MFCFNFNFKVSHQLLIIETMCIGRNVLNLHRADAIQIWKNLFMYKDALNVYKTYMYWNISIVFESPNSIPTYEPPLV